MQSRRRAVQVLIFGGLAAAAAPASSQVGDDLTISPKRLVIDPNARSATMFVLNRGRETTTYAIDLVDRVMLPDGRIREPGEAADKPGGAQALARLKSAKPMIVFSPRRVTLRPGESQTVRLRVTRPADLAAGEYRSHLTVSAVPPPDAGLTAEQAAQPRPGQMAIRIRTVFGTSIPVIVRQGERRAAAEIRNVRYLARGAVSAAPAVTLDLARTGESSLYGDIEVRAPGAPASAAPLAILRGVGVYAELDQRSFELPLIRPLSNGERVEIVFRDEEDRSGKVIAALLYAAT